MLKPAGQCTNCCFGFWVVFGKVLYRIGNFRVENANSSAEIGLSRIENANSSAGNTVSRIGNAISSVGNAFSRTGIAFSRIEIAVSRMEIAVSYADFVRFSVVCCRLGICSAPVLIKNHGCCF